MDILEFFGLFGGLALFLHGMQMMSSGLEAAAGNRMKAVLEKLTANRFMGILLGALITTAVQSSSATTVMVVGFVNAGIMNLNQAVWLIFGANVGKTTTGLLIALDVGALAPIVAFVGVFMMVFLKKPSLQHIGQLLAGLGILFIGMDMMSASMEPLREVPAFVNMMATLSNPILGIAFGAIFTALIQSSAASVGILQTLAAAGVVEFSGAVYVLFGQNIGTCITAVMASFGTSRDAKRATCVHLLFNVIGTVIFTVVVMVTPLVSIIESTVPGPMTQIAVMHVFFNLATTILLIPFGNMLAKLATRILPDLPETEKPTGMRLAYLTPLTSGGKDGGLGVSAIVVDQLRNELHRMLEMARQNVDASFKAVMDRDTTPLERVEQREQYIDFLNKEISRYISHLIAIETNERGSKIVSCLFSISGNIERIGDHADNLSGYTRMLVEQDISFSEYALAEIGQMRSVSLRAVSALLSSDAGSPDWLTHVAQMEQKIDDMTADFQRDQLVRMRNGICSDEACILYSELLTDFERIGDHVLNIAQELTKAKTAL
ncbi:Na/Pi cotransporter family protein [Pseudoflavonifractor sp. 60]|uniref:Na/Pi cotransporter family protein n=1 Tax=Pseudoflavonifractor sp. 60 TaxID=2304576 RepID=UPI0013689917|nr:Na/Pi cotransporter family protein [Pseudoflavonifractor sp. 60]NBI68944.1 Na/Pi cotransporter family protein [Pseudoflavonifractor sp. 60]